MEEEKEKLIEKYKDESFINMVNQYLYCNNTEKIKYEINYIGSEVI